MPICVRAIPWTFVMCSFSGHSFCAIRGLERRHSACAQTDAMKELRGSDVTGPPEAGAGTGAKRRWQPREKGPEAPRSAAKVRVLAHSTPSKPNAHADRERRPLCKTKYLVTYKQLGLVAHTDDEGKYFSVSHSDEMLGKRRRFSQDCFPQHLLARRGP